MKSPSSPCAERAQLAERDLLGRADRAARVQRALRLLDRRRRAVGRDVDADLLATAEQAAASSRNAIRPRDARSSIAVVSARRDVPPSMTIAPDAAVRSGGGAGIRIDGSSR